MPRSVKKEETIKKSRSIRSTVRSTVASTNKSKAMKSVEEKADSFRSD